MLVRASKLKLGTQCPLDTEEKKDYHVALESNWQRCRGRHEGFFDKTLCIR